MTSEKADVPDVELGDHLRVIREHRVIAIEECGDVLTLRTDDDDPTPYRWVGGFDGIEGTIEVIDDDR